MARMTRSSTVPSPTPASNRRNAGGRGWMLASSSETRCATTHFSRAGVDEQQVLLPVVEEAEVLLRIVRRRRRWARAPAPTAGAGPAAARCALRRARDHRRARRRVAIGRHEGADAIERLGGDAAAVAQPACELAVVDRAPAEGRFSEAGVSAIFGYFLQQLLGVHCRLPALDVFLSRRGDRRLCDALMGRRRAIKANQPRPVRSTTKNPTRGMGQYMGNRPKQIISMN